jgi:hypothetical protein
LMYWGHWKTNGAAAKSKTYERAIYLV